jgi:hypothetical protein
MFSSSLEFPKRRVLQAPALNQTLPELDRKKATFRISRKEKLCDKTI